MSEDLRRWFKTVFESAKKAAEGARGERGEKSAASAEVQAQTDLPDGEFKGAKLALALSLDVGCRMLGSALAPPERRHLFYGHATLRARGPSGECLGVGEGHMDPFVVEASPGPSLEELMDAARGELEARRAASPAFEALRQAFAISEAAREAGADAQARGARL